jgi:hypothetical protein
MGDDGGWGQQVWAAAETGVAGARQEGGFSVAVAETTKAGRKDHSSVRKKRDEWMSTRSIVLLVFIFV